MDDESTSQTVRTRELPLRSAKCWKRCFRNQVRSPLILVRGRVVPPSSVAEIPSVDGHGHGCRESAVALSLSSEAGQYQLMTYTSAAPLSSCTGACRPGYTALTLEETRDDASDVRHIEIDPRPDFGRPRALESWDGRRSACHRFPALTHTVSERETGPPTWWAFLLAIGTQEEKHD